jgi:hypothetical protein
MLPPHVHATAVDEDVVLLDIEADAYFCLPGAAAGFEVGQDRWRVSIQDRALAADLAEAGLILELAHEGPRSARATPPPPEASALRYQHSPPRGADLSLAIASTLDVALHYRGRPFRDIIRRATRHPGALRRAPQRDLLDLVDSFHRWVPFAPVSGKCLLRAFMLLRLLQREGHRASWVFGVSTWPFQAHCWLQVGPLVLDESCEIAAAYRPIMVL